MMKHAWFVAMALALLLATPAQARKECRPYEGEAPAEEAAEQEDRWPHDVNYGWHHESGGSAWVHQRKGADGADEAADSSWVHDTDYGWWAAVPSEALHETEEEMPLAEGEDPFEDCTVTRERNECVVLGNQIARYRFQLALAIERDDVSWETSLRDTIERLEERGAFHDCPWVEPSLREKIIVTVNAVVEAVGVASQVAAMLYRMGLF